jgi:hypothetical protein
MRRAGMPQSDTVIFADFFQPAKAGFGVRRFIIAFVHAQTKAVMSHRTTNWLTCD